MTDQDAQAVVDRLNAALNRSGLSLRQFAHALKTSPSRFSAYRGGRTAPSARFLLRAERIADALEQARLASLPTSLDALAALRTAAARGDDDRTYAAALEVRDRLRDILGRWPDLAAAWEAQPPEIERRWHTLVAAFIAHEFEVAGLPAPTWTTRPRLDSDWVLDTPRLTEAQVRAQTPVWLAGRGIYIAKKDLGTT